jgi:hypothetical protein
VGFAAWWNVHADEIMRKQATIQIVPSGVDMIPPVYRVHLSLPHLRVTTTPQNNSREATDALAVRSRETACFGTCTNLPVTFLNLQKTLDQAIASGGFTILVWDLPSFCKQELETAWQRWRIPIPRSNAPDDVCRWSYDVICTVARLARTGGLQLRG